MTLSDYSQNPKLMAHFAKPKSKPFRHIKGNLSGYSQNPNLLAYFENPNILSCEMPMRRIPGPCTFCNGILYAKRGYVRFNRNLIPGQGPVVTKGSFTWLIPELLQDYPYSHCSVDLILPLKSLNTSSLTPKIHELQIQSEYAPVRQHPASYRVRAYRANVRKHILYQGNEDHVFLKHRTIGPDDPDHFLMYLKTGLNPEAVESMELCFSMNDSYSVDIECISTIVLSDYPFCSSG
ncbi:hypothetical protein L2E82_52279 [Cichorium intybus]|nr:hypothetical protein L2E82_52279 [Cichorium intybus]